MAFNKGTLAQSGDFKPYIKYNSKAGRWFIREKKMVDGVEKWVDVEVRNPVLAFDFDTAQTGWIRFNETGPPDRVMDAGATAPASPGEKFKRGFVVQVAGGQKIGVREFSANANIINEALLGLLTIWETERGQHAGEVPVFSSSEVTAITGGYGTNYKPEFELLKWTERAKCGFDEAKQAPATQASSVEPPEPGSDVDQGYLEDDVPF